MSILQKQKKQGIRSGIFLNTGFTRTCGVAGVLCNLTLSRSVFLFLNIRDSTNSVRRIPSGKRSDRCVISQKKREKEIAKNVLNLPKKLPIRTECFDDGHLQRLHHRVYHTINKKWSLDFIESKPTHAGKFVLTGKSEALLFTNGLSETSLIGSCSKRGLSISSDYRPFIKRFIDLLNTAGILIESKERGNPYFQVDASVILWKVEMGAQRSESNLFHKGRRAIVRPG